MNHFTSPLQIAVEIVKEVVESLEGKICKVQRLTENIDEDLEDFNEDFEAL